jgi:hypothetical protein
MIRRRRRLRFPAVSAPAIAAGRSLASWYIQRPIDPLDSRLDIAPVTGAPGAFQDFADLLQGAN